MDPLTLKAFLEGGIGVGLAIALISILYLVVKHVLKSQDKILEMATTQNEGWQKAIGEHTAQAKQFHDSVIEAHRYQREEHKEGNNKLIEQSVMFANMIKLIEKISANLDEQGKTLTRINGYTHEGPKGDKGDKGDKGSHG
jgi:hypothetical protein